MSVRQELDRLEGAKQSIKTAIQNKGVDVPDSALLSTYANYIDAIVIPTVGSLNTNNSTAQTVPTTAESFSGTINLHKISKTGNYNDLLNKPTGFSITVTDNILDGTGGTNSVKYAPYTSRGAGHLYTGTTTPSSTNRLNYDGYFYATKLYSGNKEVLTSHQSIKTFNGGSSLKGTGNAFYAPTSAGTSGYFLKSNGSGAPTWAAAPGEQDNYTPTSGTKTITGNIQTTYTPITSLNQLVPGKRYHFSTNEPIRYTGQLSSGYRTACFFPGKILYIQADSERTYLAVGSSFGFRGEDSVLYCYVTCNDYYYPNFVGNFDFIYGTTGCDSGMNLNDLIPYISEVTSIKVDDKEVATEPWVQETLINKEDTCYLDLYAGANSAIKILTLSPNAGGSIIVRFKITDKTKSFVTNVKITGSIYGVTVDNNIDYCERTVVYDSVNHNQCDIFTVSNSTTHVIDVYILSATGQYILMTPCYTTVPALTTQYYGGSGAAYTSGTKVWANNNFTIPKIYLNNQLDRNPSFYAPTSVGNAGQYLMSNGSGAPTWAAAPGIDPAGVNYVQQFFAFTRNDTTSSPNKTYGIAFEPSYLALTAYTQGSSSQTSLIEIEPSKIKINSNSHSLMVKNDGVYADGKEIAHKDQIIHCFTNDKGSAAYGFIESTSYSAFKWGLVPQNIGYHSTYAYAIISFCCPVSGTLQLQCYQNSESSYDYGSISTIDTLLPQSSIRDSVNVLWDGYGKSGSYTVSANVSAGTHFITIKYRKDGSQSTGLDLFALTEIKLTPTYDDVGVINYTHEGLINTSPMIIDLRNL